jgi:hypothetical protein
MPTRPAHCASARGRPKTAILLAIAALASACAEPVSVPVIGVESHSFASLRSDVIYEGEIATRVLAWRPGAPEPESIRETTHLFATEHSPGGTFAVTRSTEGEAKYRLMVDAGAALTQGTWEESTPSRGGRPAMLVKHFASDGQPPSRTEYHREGALVMTVETNWVRATGGWIASQTKTTMYEDGRRAVEVTREIRSATPTGTVKARAGEGLAAAQAYGCCEDEIDDYDSALFAYGAAYATWLAACAFTGLPGCAVAAVGLGAAAIWLDGQQDDLQACYERNLGNPDCDIARSALSSSRELG